jgi:MFS transporter, DHA1 family, multidrug resistance protein
VRRIADREYIAMLALVSSLEALAIDLMLPALGDVRAHFALASDSEATARLVTFYLLGFAAQILFGPIADRFGRLPVMRTGFALYVLGSIGTAMAPTIELMLAARCVWGIGSGALHVAALAMIRDRFVGDQMARVLSLFLVVFLIVPIIAPLLGALLLAVSSWRVVFLGPLVGAVAMSLWSTRLGESLHRDRRTEAINANSIAHSSRAVFTNSATVRGMAAQTLAFAAFSSYLASSERVVGEIYQKEELFVFTFAATAILMGALSLLNARIVPRLGASRTASRILIVASVVASAVLVSTVTSGGVPPFLVYLTGFSLVVALNGMVSSNFAALALESQGDQAGMASAIYGSTQVAVGALGGAVIDGLIDTHITPLVAAFLVAAVLGLLLVQRAGKPSP